MELIRGLHNLTSTHAGCVATVGNFDGVHRGHAAIIQQVRERAKAMGVPSMVILFEPQPREFFSPMQSPARLMTLREKVERLGDLGLDRLLCVRFDRRFAALTPEQFCEDFLHRALGVRHLVVGDDFRFGSDRSGDFQALVASGHRFGFEVEDTESIQLNGRRISSTWVRESLASGDFGTTTTLLGRPFSMSGRVVHGDKIGRTLGVPTANVWPNRLVCPLRGVFAAWAMVGNDRCPAVVNLGPRPTLGGQRWRLETHLLDYAGDLYGRRLHVEFIRHVRNEEKFASLEELRQRIGEDIQSVRHLFHELKCD